MELDWSVSVRSYPGAPRGGDLGLVVPADDGALAVLIDASGHGLSAFKVAQTARDVVLDSYNWAPEKLLYQLDSALKGGIGAAISIARIYADKLIFAGIGNVQASIDLSPLIVREGVVGHRMREPKPVTATLPPDAWLLMHTDGVAHPASIPSGSAETAARTLVETHGSDHDDAGVLLARWRAIP